MNAKPFAVLALALLLPSSVAWADDTTAARDAFREGVDLINAQQWGDALAAFERASKLKPHALATYNMGVAERALGHLTRARVHFLTAIDQDARAGHTELPASFADEARGLLGEIDARLVHVDVRVDAKDAVLTIDGRPLAPDPTSKTTALFAGVATPAAKPPALGERFEVLVDPGERELVLQKEGFAPAVVRERWAPGVRDEVRLSLTALDATIRVEAERSNAVVRLQGLDVGVAPVTVRRPPGTYALDVRSPGYVTYETKVQVGPGGRAQLFAKLPKEPFILTKQWWFWTGVVAVVGGGILTAYLLTRPPADWEKGSTGWLAQAR